MLFIMRGTRCSGKDTFAHQHFLNHCHILSSDNFREMLLGDISNQKQNKRVLDFMHSVLEERFINRVNWTVLNSTNLRIKDCREPIELCKKYSVPFTFLSIRPPSIEVLNQRNYWRYVETGVKIPGEVIEKHHNRYFASVEPFLQEARYNPLCTWIELSQDYEVLSHVSN